jgi:hypothetical protein
MEALDVTMFRLEALLRPFQNRCPYGLLVGQRSDPNELGYEVRILSDLQLNCTLRLECGRLDVSQHYGPPRPVTGIALTSLPLRF